MDKENPLRSIFYIVSILAFAVCWVWRNNFAEWEYTFTEKTQKWGLEYPSQIISYEGMTGALLGYALLVYNLEAYRPRVYFEILWAVVGLGLVPLMKMIVAAPRPYMVKPSISTWKSDCECDYGMPSGHAFSATLLSVLIYKRVIEFIHPS
jgi:membrane-associated phospholipid phosphatase